MNRVLFIKNAIQSSAALPIIATVGDENEKERAVQVRREHNRVQVECKISNMDCINVQAALSAAASSAWVNHPKSSWSCC